MVNGKRAARRDLPPRRMRLPIKGSPALSWTGFKRAVMYLAGGEEYLARSLSEQFNYGHREIVLDAAGLDSSCLLLGRIPHGGWVSPATVGPIRPFLNQIAREVPQWMWNEPWAASATANGATKAVAIGAPWLYYLRKRDVPTIWSRDAQLRPGSRVDSATKRTLVVPVHSWEGGQLDFSSIPNKLKEIFDPKATTVCLSWQDFLTRRVRSAFLDAGFAVECTGHRGTTWVPGSEVADRTRVLPNLLDLITSHDQVVSDDVCTALVYAASTGKHVHVIPELESPPLIGNHHDGSPAFRFRETDHTWMLDPNSDPYDHRDELAASLGPDCLRTQEDLQRILRYRPNCVDKTAP